VTPAIVKLGELFSSRGAVTGIETGFHRMDKMTSGLQPNNLIIVAARPGMGKTSLVLNMAIHAATQHNKSVAFFSLEMGKEELVQRLLCSEARIDMSELRNGTMPSQSWERLTKAATMLNAAPIYFDDHGMMDIRYIRGKCRRQQMERGLDLVIIDYLQLMSGTSKSERREQEISEISRGLKAMAKELKVPVIALSQLNRSLEGRPDKRPMMSDLRESGAIEQDADMICFIYRPEIYAKDEKEKMEMQGKAELIIAKHRSGATGMVKLTFLDKYTKFEDFAEETAHGGAPVWE
jgi:replicative DNA helicase